MSCFYCVRFFFFQAEDGIRDLVRSRGLGDVYKRQNAVSLFSRGIRSVFRTGNSMSMDWNLYFQPHHRCNLILKQPTPQSIALWTCLLYTSDAADERSSVDLGGRRIIKKKNNENLGLTRLSTNK